MVAQPLTNLTALEAEAAANLFLSAHLPDRYCADEPEFDHVIKLWRVPIIMAYPYLGSIGVVGEITVSAFAEEILSHTPFAEMRERGRALYEQNREAIEAAFSSTRNT